MYCCGRQQCAHPASFSEKFVLPTTAGRTHGMLRLSCHVLYDSAARHIPHDAATLLIIIIIKLPN
jgi:hypothetical protein